RIARMHQRQHIRALRVVEALEVHGEVRRGDGGHQHSRRVDGDEILTEHQHIRGRRADHKRDKARVLQHRVDVARTGAVGDAASIVHEEVADQRRADLELFEVHATVELRGDFTRSECGLDRSNSHYIPQLPPSQPQYQSPAVNGTPPHHPAFAEGTPRVAIQSGVWSALGTASFPSCTRAMSIYIFASLT